MSDTYTIKFIKIAVLISATIILFALFYFGSFGWLGKLVILYFFCIINGLLFMCRADTSIDNRTDVHIQDSWMEVDSHQVKPAKDIYEAMDRDFTESH